MISLLKRQFVRSADSIALSPQRIGHEDFSDVRIPDKSPWSIALAYHARRGESWKITRIKKYYMLKQASIKGTLNPGQQEAFLDFQKEIYKEYLVMPDLGDLLEEKDTDTDKDREALADLKDRIEQARAFLRPLVEKAEAGHPAEEILADAMDRANNANRNKRDQASALRRDVMEKVAKGERYWEMPEDEGIRYMESNFPNTVYNSLGRFISEMNDAIRLGNSIKSGKDEPRAREYLLSLRNFLNFLDTLDQDIPEIPDEDAVLLSSLMYYTGQHRGATSFRKSTDELNASTESTFACLFPHMPSHDLYPGQVKRTYNCIDPHLEQIQFGIKAAALNRKFRLGYNTKDIDMAATTTSMISNIVRGDGIEEMDPRLGRYLYNPGDHSLLTAAMIAGIRDSNIARFKRDYEQKHSEGNGHLFPKEKLDKLIELQYNTGKNLTTYAFFHDATEFPGELWGPERATQTKPEQSAFRKLRDSLEEHIKDAYVPEIMSYRLNHGAFNQRWAGEDIKAYLKRLQTTPNGLVHQAAPLLHKFGEIYERLQTSTFLRRILGQGRINFESRHQTGHQRNAEQNQYTFRYALGKGDGLKQETTDPYETAEFGEAEFERTIARASHLRTNRLALQEGIPTPHRPDITQARGLPDTSLSIEDYYSTTQANFKKSVASAMAAQILKDYESAASGKISKEDAELLQTTYEAWNYGWWDELIHSTRSLARTTGKDRMEIDMAIRASRAETLIHASDKLEPAGIAMQFTTPENGDTGKDLRQSLARKKRSRIGTFKTGQVLAGTIADEEKPHQIVETFQPFFNIARDITGTLYDNVFTPTWKKVKTPFHMLLLINVARMREEKVNEHLLRNTTVQETSFDLNMTVQGLAEGRFDPKSLLMISPAITGFLIKPKNYQEASEKIMGHLLESHADEIACKYGLDAGAMKLICSRENLRKGPYHVKPADETTASGKLSYALYDLLSNQYASWNPGRKEKWETKKKKEKYEWRYAGKDHKKLLRLDLRTLDEAEKAVLIDLFIKEKVKLENRNIHEPADVVMKINNEKISRIDTAIKTLKGQASPWYRIRAKYWKEIRFGATAALGVATALSTTGLLLATLPAVSLGLFTLPQIPITLTTFAGINLAAAGLSMYLTSVKDKMEQVSYKDKFTRFLRELPYYEIDPNNKGLYLREYTKDHVQRPEKSTVKKVSKAFGRAALAPVKYTLAVPTTMVRSIANSKTFSTLLGNQNVAQTLDAAGVILKAAFDAAAHPISSGVKAGAAIGATSSARELNALHKFLAEVEDDVRSGRDRDFEDTRERIQKAIKKECDPVIMNMMLNIAKMTEGTPIGRSGKLIQDIMYYDWLTRSADWVSKKWEHLQTPPIPQTPQLPQNG